MLVLLGRLRIEDSLEDWLRIAASSATVEVIPISPAVVAEMNRLPATFH
jgi:PIN domain nuclease of toxin-antitoxin system